MAKRRDPLTLDLFDVPMEPPSTPGSLACGVELRHLLSETLKRCPYDRFEVAARMSRALGTDISKHQLDAWTAESREAWRFPMEYAAAFAHATETYALIEFLAAKRGCRVLIGEDALLAEVGRLERQEEELKARKKALKERLRRVR